MAGYRSLSERKGYGESMPGPQHDEDVEPPADVWPSRARQWCRAALALALVFGSLPLASKLIMGNWGFDDAPGIACLFLVAAVYLYLAGRVRQPPIPDSATILGEAIRVAASGETDRGIALLNEAFRLNPRLWQAREYRGQIRLGESAAAESALQDFTDAIRLAPAEPHLYILRSHVFTLLGRESAARADLDTAARLGREYPEGSLDRS
jgi:tetratricopeptide (TPR) repeat protein